MMPFIGMASLEPETKYFSVWQLRASARNPLPKGYFINNPHQQQGHQ